MPIKDFLDPGIACDTVRSAWKMRDAVKTRLGKTLPEVQRRAALTLDLIADRMGVR